MKIFWLKAYIYFSKDSNFEDYSNYGKKLYFFP